MKVHLMLRCYINLNIAPHNLMLVKEVRALACFMREDVVGWTMSLGELYAVGHYKWRVPKPLHYKHHTCFTSMLNPPSSILNLFNGLMYHLSSFSFPFLFINLEHSFAAPNMTLQKVCKLVFMNMNPHRRRLSITYAEALIIQLN